MIAEIISEKRTGPDKDYFSYLVPKKLEDKIQVGSIVEIPFGKKDVQGVIFRIQSSDSRTQSKQKYELKEVKSVNPDFIIPKQYLDVAKWISEYYLCSLGEAISLFLPPEPIRPRRIVNPKLETPCLPAGRRNSKPIELTSEQKVIIEKLLHKFSDNDLKPALLLGVTGSGKTEIYIKLAEEVLKAGKQTIVLVPEIMLTPQTFVKFEEKFPEQICLMHSGLSKSERYTAYSEFYKGEKNIMIGPRSALLVPSQNLGLIIVDEEQEDAYKQEKDPRYHAVTLAEKIAEMSSALLLLGSATPRIETFFKCHPERPRPGGGAEGSLLDIDSSPAAQNDKYDLFELKNRYQQLILPPAEIVDLKNEIKYNNFSPISEVLRINIEKVLKKKRQVLLFLNRRGMSTFVSCRECGEVLICPNCSIPLVYHINSSDYLNCHHCDYKTRVPASCPKCGGNKIKFFGAGVDKIEKEVIRLFPKARIKKIEAKTLQNKGDYKKLHTDMKNKKIDILIGTQILAKGLDFPEVDLVGVISADVGLHLPYFRANEKVFSIITQVSGRSGRTDNVGKTIIQTYWPESSAIKLAAKHDYHTFYENEIVERTKHCYPPFCHLVRVISEDRNATKAKKEIDEIAENLRANNVDFIGPAKCFLSKINNKYRYHLIIKTKKLPDEKIRETFKTNPYLIWDVDPVDLL